MSSSTRPETLLRLAAKRRPRMVQIYIINQGSWRKPAISPACAVCSPFLWPMSVMGIFQQLPRSHGFATPNGSSRDMPTVSRLDACGRFSHSIRCFAISNVGLIVNQLHSSKPLPTRVAWDWRTAAHHIVKDAPVLLYVLTVLQNVIYPTHEPVRPLKIKCLLVPAVAIDGTATVAIGQRQGGSIVRQRATEAQWGWPPDLVNHETQVVVGTGRAATAIDCVRGDGSVMEASFVPFTPDAGLLTHRRDQGIAFVKAL